jgi:ZIP family zinc transporter
MQLMWLQVYLWGLIIGAGLLLGATIAYFSNLPHKVVAAIMGFGAGVLISVISFKLIEETYTQGGFVLTIIGYLVGGTIFCTMNWRLSKHHAKNRKRCLECAFQPSESEAKGSGLAIAIGSLIDGIPEAIIVGISLIGGTIIDKSILIGFFLANIPQGLSSAEGMKGAGRSAKYIFGVWGGIALFSGIAALLGYIIFDYYFSSEVVAFMTAVAAGGILAMLAETMIPEAFDESQNFIGLITVTGFLAFFFFTKIGL